MMMVGVRNMQLIHILITLKLFLSEQNNFFPTLNYHVIICCVPLLPEPKNWGFLSWKIMRILWWRQLVYVNYSNSHHHATS